MFLMNCQPGYVLKIFVILSSLDRSYKKADNRKDNVMMLKVG